MFLSNKFVDKLINPCNTQILPVGNMGRPSDLRIVTVKIPVIYLAMIDELVENKRYVSRSEFIRTAIRRLLESEFGFKERKVKNRTAVKRL